ncbi:hypothetical protein KUH03_11850 [Sphingobacterium sp. E70]|uniref:hypothetical protein n=1 Tax=Sphingobacterium sp. E70 TaxID=2853439 RepID=UPI00211CAEB6|nr:hypothetical protein [Sphingobacterium sp. E70]ULT27373.1 hypothetical protein KUH03_11850 [Sphingobacterium sp. E70]
MVRAILQDIPRTQAFNLMQLFHSPFMPNDLLKTEGMVNGKQLMKIWEIFITATTFK